MNTYVIKFISYGSNGTRAPYELHVKAEGLEDLDYCLEQFENLGNGSGYDRVTTVEDSALSEEYLDRHHCSGGFSVDFIGAWCGAEDVSRHVECWYGKPVAGG